MEIWSEWVGAVVALEGGVVTGSSDEERGVDVKRCAAFMRQHHGVRVRQEAREWCVDDCCTSRDRRLACKDRCERAQVGK